MKDEGFLSPAGKRFVILATVLVLGGLLTYILLSEDISIDLDELTQTTEETTTDFDVDVPDVTVPEPANDPYFRCLENAQTADEIFACSER